jgi:hypothetical protein
MQAIGLPRTSGIQAGTQTALLFPRIIGTGAAHGQEATAFGTYGRAYHVGDTLDVYEYGDGFEPLAETTVRTRIERITAVELGKLTPDELSVLGSPLHSYAAQSIAWLVYISKIA